MIKTAIVAMTLLGCDCEARICTYIGETPAQWTSVGECEAAMKTQMLARSRLDYPLVTAECRSIGGAQTSPAAPQSAPAVTVETKAMELTDHFSTRAFRRSADGYEIVRSGLSNVAASLSGGAGAAVSATTRWLGY